MSKLEAGNGTILDKPSCLVQGQVCDFVGAGADGRGPCVGLCWYATLGRFKERRERVEPFARAARAAVERADRWDRTWIKWGRGIAILVVLGVLAFELARELIP